MKKVLLWLIVLVIGISMVISFLFTGCKAKTEVVEETATEDEVAEEPAEEEAAAEEPVTIKVWFHSGKGEERDVLEKQVEEFNTMQDEVIVEPIVLPEGSFNEQTAAASLAGDLPDLLDFDGPNLYNYTWAGHLIPLDEYVSSELKDDFLPSIIEQGTYGGKLYSLGTFDSGLAIWGNKAYLEKAGVRIPTSIEDTWTFEEFNEALVALQALDEVEYAIDFKMNYGVDEWDTYGFSPIIQGWGADLIDRSDYQSAEGVLNSPEAVEALTWFQSLFVDGYANAAPAGDDDFYGRKISGLSFVGHWMWTPHSEGLGDDLVLIPMPIFGKKAVTGMGSWCWGITSQSENPEAAWKFLEFLIEPDEILRMTNANGAVPARKSALAQSELYGEGGVLNIFAQQLEEGVAVPRPITPAYPTITTAFIEVIQNIVSGADVKSELDKAVKKIDQDIEDNQGYPIAE
ncbi:MAG: sugar ABC transporter substrate-binding protein [Actinomycetota bacterium]|nr:sugar ABC transporter substrate-binding protein [Actinomycetota bacterium]